MKEDKHLTIYFNNGTKMEVSFPAQIKNSLGALMEGLKKVLQDDKLVLEAEGRLIVVPWSSVQYIEASPVTGLALPFGAIKGARIIA